MAIYERLEGEPAKAWHAFTIYRDGGASRSYRQVAEALNKSERLIERWGRQWQWARRVAEYDKILDIEKRLAMREEAIKMGERHARLGTLLQSKGVERL